jgi:hypothetical protein
MNSSSHSPSIHYDSVTWHESRALPGVRYGVRRVSLGQRIELNRRIRELMGKHEFLKAGDKLEQIEATMSELLADKLYLEWGIAAVEGLLIDNLEATAVSIAEKGPDNLASEMIAAIRHEVELSKEEEKNF